MPLNRPGAPAPDTVPVFISTALAAYLDTFIATADVTKEAFVEQVLRDGITSRFLSPTAARGYSATPQEPTPHRVPATITPDDQRKTYYFDAAPWLRDASAEAVEALLADEFGGGYGADQVARDLEGVDLEVSKAFTYMSIAPRQGNGDPNGFEVRVDEDAARAFLAETRPDITQRLAPSE